LKKNRQNTIFCHLKCLSFPFPFFRRENLKFKKIVQLFCFFRTQKEDFVWCEEAKEKERKNFLFINKSLFALAAVVVSVVVVAAVVVVVEADRKLQCVSTN
jgi:hypothetical protein